MSDKTLLVIQPHIKVNTKVLAALDDAGFLVVRGEPKDFHVIGNHPTLSDPIVLAAALEAIRDYHDPNGTNNGNGVRNVFARKLATKLGYGATVTLK